MFKKGLVLILVFLGILSQLNAQENGVILFKNDNTNKKIQQLAEDKIFAHKTAGMVVVVVKDGVTQYLNAFGYSDLKDKGKNIRNPKSMKTDAIFDLASLTKVLATTQAVMMLINENKLQLNDKASTYLTEFQTPDKEEITIYDLLTHSSGLAPWRPTYMYAKNKQEVLAYIGKLPLAYKPRTNQIYSDLGFISLGAVVEKITNESLDAYISNNLYQKLGMIDTGYNISKEKKIRAVSTSWNNLFEQNMIKEGKYGNKGNPKDFKGWRNYTLKGEVDDGNAYYAMAGVSGHAGLFASASDIAKIMQLMLNGGTYNGVSFYSQEIMDNFSQLQTGQGMKGRAIGFDYSRDYMGKKRPQGTFGHIGFTGNCLAINKEKNIGIAILTNRENVGFNSNGGYTGYNDMCTEIMDSIYSNYSIN